MKCNLGTTPAVFIPEDNLNSFTYLVMPVQVRLNLKLPKEILLSELLNYSVKGNIISITEMVKMFGCILQFIVFWDGISTSNLDLKRNVWRLNQICQIIDNEIYVKGDPAISDLEL